MKKIFTLIGLYLGLVQIGWAQSAIISEWSQGTTNTNNEWVEILVLENNLNMTGWVLTDGSGVPFVTFGPAFSSIPAGTTITIHSTNCLPFPQDCPREAVLPPEDHIVVEDCNYTVIAGMETNLFVPENSKWSPTIAYSNTSNDDNPILKDANGVVVHDWDNNNTMVNYQLVRPGSGQAVYYTGNGTADLYNINFWVRVPNTSTELTPGSANGGAGSPNTTWVESIRTHACIRFVTDMSVVPENVGTTQIQLEVINPRPTIQTAEILILANSTAGYNDDYTTTPNGVNGSFTIDVPANTTFFSFPVSVVWDCLVENTEDVRFKIGNVSAQLIPIEFLEHQLRITDVPKPVPTLEVNPPGPLSICPGETITLTATNIQGANYQWQLNGNPINNATEQSYTLNTPGNYSVTIADACTTLVSNIVVVTQATQPDVVITPAFAEFCPGGSVLLTATTTANVNTYQWLKDGQPITGANANEYTATEAGSYTLQVTTDCGDLTTTAAVVTLISVEATLSPLNTTICANDNVTLSVNVNIDANTYTWKLNGQTIAGANTATYTTNQPGTYTVTVNTDCGDALTNEVTINLLPEPDVSINPLNLTICGDLNGTLTATATGNNVTYSWLLDEVLMFGENSNTLIVTEPGTYTVKINTDCGSDEATAVVEELFPQVEITPDNASICPGDQVTFTATVSSGLTITAYEWGEIVNNNAIAIPGETSNTFTTGQAGQYIVKVYIDGCGSLDAIVSMPVTVEVIQQPTASISPPEPIVICPNTNTTLTASVTGTATAYQWSKDGVIIPNATQSTLSINSAGNYSVEITTACGTADANVNVTEFPAPNGDLIPNNPAPLCPGQSLTLTAQCDQPVNAYVWQKDGQVIPNENTDNLTVNQSGTYAVSLTTQCHTLTFSTQVTVLPNPSVQIEPNNATICPGQSATLTATANLTPNSFEWKRDNVTLAGQNTASITVTEAGTYTVSITTDCGNVTSNQVIVSVTPLPTASINANTQTFCEGSSLTLSLTTNATNVSGYQWQKDAVNIPNAIASTFSATEAGSYTATLQTECGSITTLPITLTQTPKPTITLNVNSATICPDASVDLVGTSNIAVTYQWQKDGTNLPGATNNTYQANSAGTYTLKVTAECGTADASAQVSLLNPSVTITTSADGFCPGDSVRLKAVANFVPLDNHFVWLRDNLTTVLPTLAEVFVQQAGTYTATALSECGLINSTTSLAIIAYTKPTIDAQAQSLARANEFQLTATGGQTYVWKPYQGITDSTSASITAKPKYTTTYTVYGKNAVGCVGQDTVTVFVIENDISIVNVFTPNGDGVNDGISLNNLVDFDFVQFLIYDRWGNLVWKANGKNDRWLGLDMNNKELIPGAYVYYLKLLDRRTDKELFKTGTITLIR